MVGPGEDNTCPRCVESGAFCNQRPESSCRRLQNANDAADEPRPESGHHCACSHGCGCDSVLKLVRRCECGDAHLPSSCTCGNSHVSCSGCRKVLCRLCNRACHSSESCLEDLDPTDQDNSPQYDALLAKARRAAAVAADESELGLGLGSDLAEPSSDSEESNSDVAELD